MKTLFALGLGYSAAATGDLLLKEGWKVAGTVREASRMIDPLHRGFSPVLFDDTAALGRMLATTTHLLLSAAPRESGHDPVLAAYGAALEASSRLEWIGYLSTIGVYGNRDGAWVDENTPPKPSNGRNVARVEAETAWTRFAAARGLPLDIFRLSGIYGPGRSPLDKVARGEAQRIVKPGQVFNRIHLHDIAQTVVAAIAKADAGGAARIFNVTDDEPAPPQDVVAFAAELLGVALPPEVPFPAAELSPMGRSFYEDNKRVRNNKIKRELGVSLRYATYREGLRALAKLR